MKLEEKAQDLLRNALYTIEDNLKAGNNEYQSEREKLAQIIASDVGFIKAIKLEEWTEMEQRERVEGEIKKTISDRRKQEETSSVA